MAATCNTSTQGQMEIRVPEIDGDADDENSVVSLSPRNVFQSLEDTDESMVELEEDDDDDDDTFSDSKKSPSESKPEIPAEVPVDDNKEPPTPKVEPPDRELSPRTPPAAHQANNNAAIHRSLKFSIDNILKPDFGRRSDDKGDGAVDEPVDLSRVTASSVANHQTKPTNSQPAPGQVTKTLTTSREKEILPLGNTPWPAWVYCTRYSDRPSAGPRTRRIKKRDKREEKRPRTAFTSEQLSRLKKEFQENRYLTEKRRQDLARDLGLNESQIKIWFQNKRAKIKKQVSNQKNPLALQLMAQGLYNHSTIPIREEEEQKILQHI